MEMLVGCIFTLILIAFLFFFCKNVTFTVRIEYPETNIPELENLYDDEGDPKGVRDMVDYDELLKEINDLMLDQEDEPNE